jgi:hypothetical protein
MHSKVLCMRLTKKLIKKGVYDFAPHFISAIGRETRFANSRTWPSELNVTDAHAALGGAHERGSFHAARCGRFSRLAATHSGQNYLRLTETLAWRTNGAPHVDVELTVRPVAALAENRRNFCWSLQAKMNFFSDVCATLAWRCHKLVTSNHVILNHQHMCPSCFSLSKPNSD